MPDAPFEDRLAALTPRERQVYDRVVAGEQSDAIGFALGSSPRTVDAQRSSVLRKMGARNAVQLAREAGWHFGPAS